MKKEGEAPLSLSSTFDDILSLIMCSFIEIVQGISENCDSDPQNIPSTRFCAFLLLSSGLSRLLDQRRHGRVCASLRDEHVVYHLTRLGPATVTLLSHLV